METSQKTVWNVEALEARVFKDFKIGNEKVNLVLVDDIKGDKKAFICNFDIHPVIAHHLYRIYGKRWGIETYFKNLENDFMAKTTSTNFNIRMFYFLFSACLYNFWVLLNICASLKHSGRIEEKPRVTAKMFIVILYGIEIEFVDSGG